MVFAFAAAASILATVQSAIANPEKSALTETTPDLKETDQENLDEAIAAVPPTGEKTNSDTLTEDSIPDDQPASETTVSEKSAESTTPVLVTGTPPPDEEPIKTPLPEAGVAVRVEKMSISQGSVDPTQVKLLAPYPAKPMSQAPVGWRLDTSDSATPFTEEVEISSGAKITLTIRPHLLVPDSDGAEVFSISEPGYDSALGYQQTATVGAVLANSIHQLDEDSKQLGASIDRLQQLLVSLPKPEPQAAPAPAAKPSTFRRR